MRTFFTLFIALLLVLNACSKSEDAEPTQDSKGKTTEETAQKTVSKKTGTPKNTNPKTKTHKLTKKTPETVTVKKATPKTSKIPTKTLRPEARGGDLPAPADVAAPPADAQKTASGLASKVLKAGTGTKKPAATDRVRVHYTGWTTDGKMFDSSVKRGKPTEFGLNRVIKGWTEGLKLMVAGEKRRFWIPEELAYKGSPGRPQGMLVFDVELLEIKEMPKPPAAPEDLAKAPANAQKLKDGVLARNLKAGDGKTKPQGKDVVTFHFTAWSSDGNVIDSSITRGRAVEIPLDRLPGELKIALSTMTPGGKARFWVPEAVAAKGLGRGRKGPVVMDLELIKSVPRPKSISAPKKSISAPKKSIPAPKSVAAAPKDAQKTASGLASKVLAKGTGKVHPTAQNKVTVHYTGWTTDGTMFDSSVTRDSPATFPLSGVIKGWTEGVQLMVVGEKRRFWIPENLAYKGRPGAPQGMLVFDVELLSIQ